MIHSLWLCNLMINIKSYFPGIIILLLITNDFGLAKESNLNGKFNPQGNKPEKLMKNDAYSNYCNKNLERLLSYTSIIQQKIPKSLLSSQLSSNRKPLNQNSSSSTATIRLPQGNKSVRQKYFTVTPFLPSLSSRIDSYEKKIIPAITGCIDTANYNWKYDRAFVNDTERLSGVQIFLFHLNTSSNDISIDVNLKIILYSTQESASALNRPVVVVLSSFLPRKFYLSAISFLSHSHQPLHLILTHRESEVIIKDEQFTNADLKHLDKLFISYIDLSNDRLFPNMKYANEKELFDVVNRQLMKTSVYKYGYFDGVDYSGIEKKKDSQKLWLFNNEKYSESPIDMRIVSIYLIKENINFVDLILGKSFDSESLSNEELIYGCHSGKALKNVITTFMKYEFNAKPDRVCFYKANSVPSLGIKYQTSTWLHIESVNNVTSEIELIFSRHPANKKNETYLLILTGNNVVNSTIKFISFFPKHIQILTNLSLNQFDRLSWLNSTYFTLKTYSNLKNGSIPLHILDNYIAAQSLTPMITAKYQFISHSSTTYRIRINIDDSNSIPKRPVINQSCSIYSQNNISVSVTINTTQWKTINNWIPSEFHLGDNSCIFRKKEGGLLKITKPAKHCSSNYVNRRYVNEIFEIWKRRKLLMDTKINLSCKKYNSKMKEKLVTTKSLKETDPYIPKLKDGILISNKSDFKFSIVKPLHDKMVLYIQITNNINGIIALNNKIQLRDCFITDQKASLNDFKSNEKTSHNFRKMTIIHEGCLDNSSHWYSSVPEYARPNNHLMSDNLFKTFTMYRFPILVDANEWASKLNLMNQWIYKGQYEVHLYCGINKCYLNQNSKNLQICRSQYEQCNTNKSGMDPVIKYYGTLKIVNNYEHVFFKISILIILIIVMFVLLICLIIFFWRLMLRQTPRQLELLNKCVEHGQTNNSEVSFSSPHKDPANLNYHSLTLLTNSGKKSSVKLYSEPQLIASLKCLMEKCDKSIYLQAGYLVTPVSEQSQYVLNTIQPISTKKNSNFLFQSASENSLTEPTNSNWVINSWPLSTAERKSKFHKPKNPQKYKYQPSNEIKYKPCLPPTSYWLKNPNSSGSSSKQKISYVFNSELKSYSNQKVSSNRTTVSESLSANEPPSKSISKWWSLLTNHWMNRSFVMTRN